MSDAPKKYASLGQVFKAVIWAFAGIRRQKDYEKDALTIHPVHVIVVGIVAAVILVLSLIAIVKFFVLAK